MSEFMDADGVISVVDDVQRVEELHRLGLQSANSAVAYAIACGDELLRMKSVLGHGNFLPWCSQLSFSQKTANNYMLAARMAPQICTAGTNLSLKGLLAAINSETKQAKEDKQAADLARPVRIALPAGIHRGDFRELSAGIDDDSVDLIFTDPPYDGDSVVLYEDAARIAARILKPGASMIAYSGQRYLPDVLAGMSKHLRYWWTIAGVHEGGNQMLQKLGIRCGWKPLVWFVKDTRGDVQNVMFDVVRGDREKDAHEWQQSQIEAVQLIEKLCAPGGVVVDFCLGGGTTAVACKHLGRRFIGFEVNAQSLERSVERLAA